MSWLNLNESLSSLKGQITNFATEVLSEAPVHDTGGDPDGSDHQAKQLQEKCRKHELEIAALKKLTDDLQSALQAERISQKNGVKEDDSNWYWDPPTPTKPAEDVNSLSQQIQTLKDALAATKERKTHENNEEVERLKEENKHLTANLEDLDNQHQQAMERLLSLKKELQKNFEVLKQEHEDLKTANDEYEHDIKSLGAKLVEKDKEIQILSAVKSENDTLIHKYQNLERIHSLLRENAENFQEENQELHEENFKLQEQVTKLEHELELSKKNTETSNAVPRETYEELLKDFNDLKERRNTNEVHQDEMNIDDNAKSVIESLKREIGGLKHKLAQKQSEIGDVDNANVIKSDKVMQLYNKYVNFELPVDYVGEMPATENGEVLYKVENAFKALYSFKKEMDALEHSITEKNLKIKHLKTQVDDITSENDFLRSDIQHFERELNEMRENNEFLISEIAALKNTSKLEPISETHEDNFSKLENELADSNKINKSFKGEIERIEKELEEVKTEKVSLQSALDDLKVKYTTMLTELDSCKNQTKDIVDLEKTIQQLNSEKLKQYTDEIDNMKQRLTSAITNNEKLLIDMHIIENEKVLLTKELNDTRHELDATIRDLKIKVHELQENLNEFSCSKTDVDNDKKALQDIIKDLENQLQTLSFEKSNNTNIDQLQFTEQISRLSADNSTLEQSVEYLTKKVEIFKQREHELLFEIAELKSKLNAEEEQSNLMKNTIEEYKSNSEQVKAEIKTITEKKLEVEAELTATDTKILKLEQEFEILVHDLNDKDTIIDSLNETIAANNVSLTNLTQNVLDLENSVAIKNKEIERLRKDSTDVITKLNHLSETSSKAYKEYGNLMREKEEISMEMTILQDHINAKNAAISELKNKIDELERECQKYKMYSELKDKEIKELNQSLVAATDKMRSNDTANQNNEYDTLTHERNTIAQQVNDLNQALHSKDEELSTLKSKLEELERTCVAYKEVIDTATKEKTELVNLITLKHNESIQYHNEIQRLNNVLLEQSQGLKKINDERDNQNQTCQKCENLRMGLKEKDEIIMLLNQKSTDSDGVKGELLSVNEEVKSLSEKCSSLEKTLAIQLDTVKRLSAENLQLQEQVSNSSRELDRLRQHLVATEESYTQELMSSEQKLSEAHTRLQQLEERSKQHSTVYTSNSIRANQEVETLRNQIRLLEKQREEVQAKLASADDARNRSEAALTNLQLVLEQFQLDKERDIESATVKLHNKMADMQQQNGRLQRDIASLTAKLEESYAGLQAASRLGDQLEEKTAVIQDLREQVRTLQTSVTAAEDRYYNTVSHQQDKVDKNLVKNLVVNLHSQGQSSNRTQVLRILSSVLDFNQQECERLGLARATPAGDSLAQEFVKFLEKESRPAAALPNMMSLAGKPAQAARRNSALGPQPHPYSAGHSRTPSASSNNLLFTSMDQLETASQVSIESASSAVASSMTDGVNQTRNTEGAILKQVLKDM